MHRFDCLSNSEISHDKSVQELSVVDWRSLPSNDTAEPNLVALRRCWQW